MTVGEIKEAIARGVLFRAHAFELACAKNDIDHRLTKPKHPWTNGQVERMNRTIKEATVQRFYYESHPQLRQHLADFVPAYNFGRRLKTLMGLTPPETLNESGFMAPKNSTDCRARRIGRRILSEFYERLRALAAFALSSEQSTILDAVHLRPEERHAAEMVAAQNNAHFTGLWLEAPLGMVRERITKRAMDASDATVEVVTTQAKHERGAIDWQPLDASGFLETTVAGASAAILG